MSRKHSTRIGDGAHAVMLKEVQQSFPSLQVIHRSDDIRQPTDWSIHADRHSIVVHLGGHMDRLETEMDGFGGSSGSALPGEIWTVPAGRRYASHACGKIIEYVVLRLAPDAADAVGNTSQGRLDIRPVAGLRDDFLLHASRQLVTAMQADDDVSTMLAQALSQVISLHVLRSLSPGGALDCDKKQNGPVLSGRITRKLREHVQQRLGERLTLDELATLAGMTTHQLLVAFRKVFGSTPGQYIIQQRIREAQRQLLNSKKDITTIALECGFSSHSHLTACFARVIGCTPKVFRATSRQVQWPAWRK